MDFWTELISSVVGNGVFAMLFVFLLFYQLKDSQKREQAYRNTINDLSNHLMVIEQVRQELEDLKYMLSQEEK